MGRRKYKQRIVVPEFNSEREVRVNILDFIPNTLARACMATLLLAR